MMTRESPSILRKVFDLAHEYGFDAVGVAPAEAADGAWRERFENWLSEGHAGQMDYLHRDPWARFDPRTLLPEARSVIVLATSYAPDVDEPVGDLWVGRYARGRDYHKVLKRRAHRLCDALRAEVDGFVARSFVDTGPISEKSLAVLAGLGWIGRNGLLIVPGLGSYVLLTEIICNLPLPPGNEVVGGCGSCRRCVSACPTSAILENGLIDPRRCLSYLNKGRRQIPREYWPIMGRWIFGCDICQEVCPHNRDVPLGDAQLRASADHPPLKLAEVLSWSEEQFDEKLRGSPLRREGYRNVLRHAVIAAGNSSRRDLIPALRRIANLQRSLRDAVDWACERLSEESHPPATGPQ